MILLTSSGAVGGMHAKLANGPNQHNWFANALIGEGLYETKYPRNRIFPMARRIPLPPFVVIVKAGQKNPA